MQQAGEKLTRGSQRLSAYTEDQLAITTPKDEVWRQDMVRLYRYRPTVEKPGACRCCWPTRWSGATR
jgi:hypothetical protein